MLFNNEGVSEFLLNLNLLYGGGVGCMVCQICCSYIGGGVRRGQMLATCYSYIWGFSFGLCVPLC